MEGVVDRGKLDWEKDIKEQISWEEWIRMSLFGRKLSRNVAIRENFYKQDVSCIGH